MIDFRKGAIRGIKFYKHIVQSVEKFIQVPTNQIYHTKSVIQSKNSKFKRLCFVYAESMKH